MTTQQLETAMAKARMLPAAQQVALAALILEEIASEERWDAQFAESPALLAALADDALAEDSRGETRPLDESIE